VVAVCHEIVRRAQINLRTLHRRLLDLGYEFAEPEAALKDAACPCRRPRQLRAGGLRQNGEML
jgi:hypothetical protein